MDKKFILKFSFKNLWVRKTRAILTLLGIAISFASIVFLMSLAFGLERVVTNEVTKGNAFVDIDVGTDNSEVITLTDSTLANIKNISGVKNIYSTVSVGAVASANNKTMDVSFSGTSSGYLNKTGVNIAKGRNLNGVRDEILVNTAFLQFWSNGNDDVLGRTASFDIVVPQDVAGTDENLIITNQNYRIAGIIKDDSSPKVYTDYNNMRQYRISSYDQFKVEVENKERVTEVRHKIENLGLKTQYVGDTVDDINQVFNVVRAVFAVFGLIALAVALLGMFNMLTLSLLERIKEIAVMKMLGIRQKDLRTIFITESIILGVSGGILGIFLGIVTGNASNTIVNYFASKMGAPDISLFYAPPDFVLIILLFSLLIGCATGLYPAQKAVKVKSLDALRYE